MSAISTNLEVGFRSLKWLARQMSLHAKTFSLGKSKLEIWIVIIISAYICNYYFTKFKYRDYSTGNKIPVRGYFVGRATASVACRFASLLDILVFRYLYFG
jgi:hypothetical protein